MVLSLSISPEVEASLKARASAERLDIETFAQRQLELVAAAPSLRAISGPIPETFESSGENEDELAAFLETEKHAARKERRARSQ